MASKTALGYVLDDNGTLVDAFIQATGAADPAPTAVEKEIVRIVKEHREHKAEKEAKEDSAKGNLIITLLMDMQRACPVACRTSISIVTKNRGLIVLYWEYTVKKQRRCVENRISWIELQRVGNGRICFDEVTERIRNSFLAPATSGDDN